MALRALGVDGTDGEATKKLQRYILGLALIAFLAPAELYLRQGCLLVASPSNPAKKKIVWRNGKRDDLEIGEREVPEFAKESAKAFGVGDDVSAVFDPKLVTAKVDAKNKKNKDKKNKSEAKAVAPEG